MYHFILNPAAGKGKSRKVMRSLEPLLSARGIPYRVIHTKGPQDAAELVSAAIAEGAEHIVAVGGDGTLNEVLNGFTDFEQCDLGLIPCGTGNDFAKFSGIPKKPAAALELILSGMPKRTDFFNVNQRRVINVAGMGIDVEVLERCRRMKFFKGKVQYLLSLLVSLCKIHFFPFTVSVDGGEPQQKEALITAVCNGKYFGGGLKISPESDIGDNKLNLIIVNKVKKRKVPGALIGLLRGKLLKYPFVEQHLCERVDITTPDGHNLVNTDGELYRDIPFQCTLHKNLLRMYRP